jgi:hypothetical protein
LAREFSNPKRRDPGEGNESGEVTHYSSKELLDILFIECGVGIEEFWKMTWYETNLYLLRLHEQRKKETTTNEMHWDMTRRIMATVINMSGKTIKTAVKPQDIMSLSTDEEEENVKPRMYTPEEVDRMVAEIAPKALKKNGK